MGVFSGLTGRGSGAAAESYSVCGIISRKKVNPLRKDYSAKMPTPFLFLCKIKIVAFYLFLIDII